jgi:hypothetical protein
MGICWFALVWVKLEVLGGIASGFMHCSKAGPCMSSFIASLLVACWPDESLSCAALVTFRMVQGVCITLCSRSKEDRVPLIERKAGFKFDRIGPPQPKEMASVAAGRAVETICQVPASVVPWFKEAAAALLKQEPDAETALAKALAKLTRVLPMVSACSRGPAITLQSQWDACGCQALPALHCIPMASDNLTYTRIQGRVADVPVYDRSTQRQLLLVDDE